MRFQRFVFGPALLLLGLFAAPGRAAAQFALSTESPVVGQPVTLTLSEPAEQVVVTYRPGSSIAASETLPTAGGTTVQWTPARAGLAQIALPGGGSRYISVRYESYPGSGFFMLVLAGAILFGGAGFAFRVLWRPKAA